MFPGGTMHLKMGGADGLDVIDVTLPAEIGKMNCVPPWADIEIDLTNPATLISQEMS